MTDQHPALQSLREGSWFKLICGASYQHLPAIRNLTLTFTLAGADCIDVAADPAVIVAAKEGIDAAIAMGQRFRPTDWASVHPLHAPLLMVSLNDGEDPHFRKAEFIATACPHDCSRPCEAVCPADAINYTGVIADRCYGCGRCLSVCPIQHISTRSYVSTPQAIAPLILEAGIDAIEIHTQPNHLEDFQRLWTAIHPWANQLKLLAISCPDGEAVIEYLQALYDIISPLPCPLIWQTDGRPMSGDIGAGATNPAIQLGQKVLRSGLPGYVQLAGGTNDSTVPKLKSLGLLKPDLTPPEELPFIAGVAYGSYARVLLSPILEELETMEIVPDLLEKAVNLASSLVSQLKPQQHPLFSIL